MEVAYLIKQDRSTHTILLANRDVDQTGLLKARTYLAFLQSKKVLKQVNRGEWERVYYESDTSFKFDRTAFEDKDVLAAVPYLPFEDIWNQPGLAIIKHDLEAQRLFSQVYLRSSSTWLHSNPHKLAQIEEHFSKRLQTA